jgi:hypothetical protein
MLPELTYNVVVSTLFRRYYYSIKEISVGGRCLCNGHAYICPPSPLDPNILQCECQRNTAGQPFLLSALLFSVQDSKFVD